MSRQGRPDGDTAVGDPRTVPAGPVVSVHAAVLKPDVADAGWVVGERVRDLQGWEGGQVEGEREIGGKEGAKVLVLDQESAELSSSPNSVIWGRPLPLSASASSSVKWSKILPGPLHSIDYLTAAQRNGGKLCKLPKDVPYSHH